MTERNLLALIEANLRAALSQLVDPWAVRQSAEAMACNARLVELRQAQSALPAETTSLAHTGAAAFQACQPTTMH